MSEVGYLWRPSNGEFDHCISIFSTPTPVAPGNLNLGTSNDQESWSLGPSCKFWRRSGCAGLGRYSLNHPRYNCVYAELNRVVGGRAAYHVRRNHKAFASSPIRSNSDNLRKVTSGPGKVERAGLTVQDVKDHERYAASFWPSRSVAFTIFGIPNCKRFGRSKKAAI